LLAQFGKLCASRLIPLGPISISGTTALREKKNPCTNHHSYPIMIRLDEAAEDGPLPPSASLKDEPWCLESETSRAPNQNPTR